MHLSTTWRFTAYRDEAMRSIRLAVLGHYQLLQRRDIIFRGLEGKQGLKSHKENYG